MSRQPSHIKQVFKNTIAGLFGNTGSALVGLAITPYLIYRLGFESYGFWVVLSTVVNYVGLIDVGLETTFIKYTAEYASTQQHARVRQVTTFGVIFYVILSIVMAPLALLAAPFIINLMKVSPQLAYNGAALFALIIVAFFLQSAGGVIGSVLGGIGSLRLVSLANFLGRLTYALSAVALCSFGLGIRGLLVATFVQIGCTTAICYFLARRRFGPVFTNPLRLERDIVQKLFRLGGWIQLTNLSNTITMETNRLIIAIFIQTSAVTLFEVANKVTRTVRSLPFNFIVALLPAVSAREALGHGESFNEVYIRAARYMNLATIGLVGFVIAAASPLTRAWLGHTYSELPALIALIGISYIASNATSTGTTMLRAIGQARPEAIYSVVNVAATVVAMAVLIPRFGLIGVAASMACGSICSSGYFLWSFHRLRSLPVGSGFLYWYAQLLLAGTVASILTRAALPAMHLSFFATRLGGIVESVLDGLLFFGAFAIALIATRFFSVSDAAILRRILPSPIRRMLLADSDIAAAAT